MTSAWDLIKTKQYEAAVREYGRLYREQGSEGHLHNRGLAYLLMGDYVAASGDFQHSIQTGDPRRRGTHEHIFAGVSSWYLDRPDEAVSIWRAGLSAPYADAAGGVQIPALLLYAGCRLRSPALEQEALQLLKKHWRDHLRRQKRRQERSARTHADFVHPGLVAWPGAIVPFLLGEVDRTQLQAAVDHAGSEVLKQRCQCAADFYVGLHAARGCDLATFHDRMRLCTASDEGVLEHEFHLARWEVDRGFPQPAFSTR